MKPRTVIVGLEIVTDLPLSALRKAHLWGFREAVLKHGRHAFEIQQVSANVVQPTKPEARCGKG